MDQVPNKQQLGRYCSVGDCNSGLCSLADMLDCLRQNKVTPLYSSVYSEYTVSIVYIYTIVCVH